MMHSFILMAVVTVIWAIGRLQPGVRRRHAVHRRPTICVPERRRRAPNADYAATIPQQTFMIYQLMFAIITPALISGAFAERMKFSAMLLFTTLWMFIVYFPMAHMVWGKGGLLNAYLGGKDSLLRFRRRHGGAHHFRRFGAGVRAVSGQAQGVIRRSR
jgi:ammonium transporter, Amt family